MEVNFTGFNEQAATFLCDGTVTENMPVMVKDDGSVTKALAGSGMLGIAKSVRGGYASVQMHGYMRLPFSGSIFDRGVISISADGFGGIKPGTGRTALVLELDLTNKIIAFDLV